MAKIDYQALYALQDRVLSVLFSVPTGFYLTGGTCLHRFYHEQRYSDDLDLFSKDNALFREDVRMLRQLLTSAGFIGEMVVDSRDFVRLILNGVLKLDLVNDRVWRNGHSIRTKEGIALDNLVNIGANKICAVLGRDDPKDVFDLYTIFRTPDPDWQSILSAAAHKCALDREELRFRLDSFPLTLMDALPAKHPDFLVDLRRDYCLMTKKLMDAAQDASLGF